MRGFVILLAIVCSGLLPAAEVTVMDEIICKVNGDIITRNDLERSRKETEASLKQQGLTGQRLEEALDAAAKNILRERIDQLLMVQKGKELNLNVDADVVKQIADIQRNVKIADPEKFQEMVREQTGMPFEDYKAELKNQLLSQRVIRQEVSGKITFKHDELEKYYNAHKSEYNRPERVLLREILISTEKKDATAVAAAQKKATDLVGRARKGERFPEMAIANSDSATAAQGGDIGSFEKGALRADLETLVWNQPRGYVTEPITMPNGLLIIKVEEHQKAGIADLEEVQGEIQEKLFGPQLQPALRTYMTKLRQEAFLEIKPGFVDSGAAPGKNTAWQDPAELKPETVTKEEVAARGRRKHLIGIIPIPGTNTTKTGSSSSR